MAKIAAVLEQNGHEVEILDAPALKASHDEAVDVIRRRGPDIIGITSITPTIGSALRLARGVREVLKDAAIVLGGPHATVLPMETLLNAPEVDIAVIGEGEATMLDLVETFEDEGKDVSQVEGIAYRDQGVKLAPPRPHISPLDSLPTPAYHLLPLEKYRPHPPFGRRLPFMFIETSRGCPYRCTFCSKPVFGTKYRAYSPKYMADEIELLVEKHGVKELAIVDDTFTLDKKRVLALCEEIKNRGISVLWTCDTRVNLVDEEILRSMREAGCYMIAYGVESGSQEIIDNLKKDITLEQIRRAFKITNDLGIETIAYFMIGSPGETPETISKTIELAKHLDPDFAQFSVTTPFPGTELFEMAKEQGMVLDEWHKFVYAGIESSEFPVFQTEALTREDLKNYTKKAYRSFYLRPGYIWKRLKQTRSLTKMKTNIAGLRMFLDMSS